VDLVTDQFVCSAQKLRGEKDNRGGTVPNFLVLLRGEGYKDTGLGVRRVI
jgi:hypothetical protein